MSDTPRTDALLFEINEGRVYQDNGPKADFARGLERECAELRQGYERYQTARLLNPRAWKDAFELNLKTGKPFDEIIDDLRPFVRPK